MILPRYRRIACNRTSKSHHFYSFAPLADLLQNKLHLLHLPDSQWSLCTRGFIRFGLIPDEFVRSMMGCTLIEAEESTIEVTSRSNLRLKSLCSLV